MNLKQNERKEKNFKTLLYFGGAYYDKEILIEKFN